MLVWLLLVCQLAGCMAEMQIVAEDVAAPTLDMDVNLEVDDKRAAFIKAVNAEFVLAVGKYGGPGSIC